jgi:hypothetical protein
MDMFICSVYSWRKYLVFSSNTCLCSIKGVQNLTFSIFWIIYCRIAVLLVCSNGAAVCLVLPRYVNMSFYSVPFLADSSFLIRFSFTFTFLQDVGLFAKTPRAGQAACFALGIFIFFDDYANVLIAGKTLRPLLDLLFVSREKLAFIVDATAAPIASLSPVSSWVGFEVGLIQEQIDRLIELEGTEELFIETSGFAVFLQSIKYRYYPIFMIILMMALIFSERDFGSMLIAERKTRVYQRSDGGDGAGMLTEEVEEENPNKPRKDQPLRSWNMVFPVLMLVRDAWTSILTFDPFHRTGALTPFSLDLSHFLSNYQNWRG